MWGNGKHGHSLCHHSNCGRDNIPTNGTQRLLAGSMAAGSTAEGNNIVVNVGDDIGNNVGDDVGNDYGGVAVSMAEQKEMQQSNRLQRRRQGEVERIEGAHSGVVGRFHICHWAAAKKTAAGGGKCP